jgi:hypothetical protein
LRATIPTVSTVRVVSRLVPMPLMIRAAGSSATFARRLARLARLWLGPLNPGNRLVVIGNNHLTRLPPELLIAAGRSATGFPDVIGAHADTLLQRFCGRLRTRALFRLGRAV